MPWALSNNMIYHLSTNLFLTALIAISFALSPLKSYAALPLAALGLPLAMRIGAPLATTSFRWLVQRVGQNNASLIASTELHLWVGAALLGVTFSKPSTPINSDSPPNSSPIDGPVIWLDQPAISKFTNPETNSFNDASALSSDKQPTAKTSVDKTEGYPSAPANFPAVVQEQGGSDYSWSWHKSTQGVQTKNIRTKFWSKNVDIALSHLSSNQRCVSSNINSIKPELAPASSAWCGSVSVNGSTKQFAVWQQVSEVSCDAGYSRQADGGCALTTPIQVAKPQNHQCEYIRTSSGWTADPKNPNCTAYTAKVTTPTPQTLVIRDGQRSDNPSYFEQDISISTNGNDVFVLHNDPGGTRYNLTTTANGSGQQVISGINTTGGSTTAPGSTTPLDGSSGGGGGSGTGTGNVGSGTTTVGGTCGGTNQTPCSIDDSGFNAKTHDISIVQNQLSASVADFEQRVQANSGNPHGIHHTGFFSGFRFGLPQTVCQNPDLNFGNGFDLTVDLCGNQLISLFRQIEAWLFYVFTVFYVWRRFMSAEEVAAIK
jgi:hypothetical protein